MTIQQQDLISPLLTLNAQELESREKDKVDGGFNTTVQLRGSTSSECSSRVAATKPVTGAEAEQQRIREVPDGGWGWAVVFASFMIHLIADGVTYTFGLFYFELIRYFASSKGLTAWVPSIMTGMTFAIGPVASGLTNQFGCRAISILGSLLAAFGLLVSVWAPSVLVLLFTIGVCTGAGMGLIYLPGIVAVTMYFDKKRAFATGIAACGSGVGSAIFAPFTELLINSLGWQHSMIIIAVLVALSSLCGLLFRPLQIDYEPEECEEYYEEQENGEEKEKDIIREDAIAEQEEESSPKPDGMFEISLDDSSPLTLALDSERSRKPLEKDSIDEEPLVSLTMSPIGSLESSKLGSVIDSIAEEPELEKKPLPPGLPPIPPKPRGLKSRRLMPSIRSDVNLKIMMPDSESGVFSPPSASMLQSAPVQESPTRHLSFSKGFKFRNSNPRSMASDSTNTVIAQPMGSTSTKVGDSRVAVNRSISRTSSTRTHSSSRRRTPAGSQATLPGIMGRADIFYSRSTLNLQPHSQSRSNVMLYNASSNTVSDYFKKSTSPISNLQPRSRHESTEPGDDLGSNVVDDTPDSRLRTGRRIGFSRQVTVEPSTPAPVPEEDEDQLDEEEKASGMFQEEPQLPYDKVSVVSVKTCMSCCPPGMVQMLELMMDFKILSNPLFVMFAMSNFVTSFGYYVPHIYLKDKAIDSLGEEHVSQSDASNLIALVGLGSTFGRLFFGYMSDWPSVNRLFLYNCCLILCGLSVICTSFTSTYVGLATYSTVFGVFCGAYVSLISVILVDLLGLEKLTNAFGILLLFQGFASVMGPPIIGWIYDLTGSYNPGFNLAGGMISLSGLMLFAVPYMETKPYIHMLKTGELARNTVSYSPVPQEKEVLEDETPPGVESDPAYESTVTTVIHVPSAAIVST